MTTNRTTTHTESGLVRNGSKENGIARQTIQVSPVDSVKRLGTGCRRWFAESIFSRSGNKVEFRFSGPVHLLILYHEGTRRAGETAVDGLAPSIVRSFVNKFTFVPAGHSYRERHETSLSTRITFLYLDPEKLAGRDGTRTSDRPLLYCDDFAVIETAAKIKNAIESGEPGDVSYLEALSSVLAHELSHPSGAGKNHSLYRGGLANWQKTTVIRYIETHLNEQIILSTLAGLVRLSDHHFCRSFKQSFGVPPRRYQMQRRIESAKSLLADRSIPITEIGLAVGYSQSSSFSDAFRKMTGWSPSEYRRQFE
jgi:AraC family transcriptional regulator